MKKTPLDGILKQVRSLAARRQHGQATDAELLRQFIAHCDEGSFEILVHRHGPMVLRVAQGILRSDADAEDVFQGTFLILARKAGSIRRRASLASWLHGVARRLALHARSDRERRRTKESRAFCEQSSVEGVDTAWHELREVLDNLLAEMPEKYRAPLICCYLEGRTQEEVARQFEVPLGTVRSWLARGRELLRSRLARHGMVLSTAGLGTTFLAAAASAATAIVPARLIQTTVVTAAQFAAGTGSLAGVPVSVATLVREGISAMLMAKVKSLVAMVAVVGLVVTGMGFHALHAGGSRQEPGSQSSLVSSAPGANPERPGGALESFAYLDLEPYANQKLTDDFGTGREGNNLASLSKGEQTFEGVKFKITDGFILLGSKLLKEKKPEKVEGIKVSKAFAKLHLLHATAYGLGMVEDPLYIPDGRRIAEYKIRYADGGSETVPVVYGEDVRDWWFNESTKGVTRGKVAWTGDNQLAKSFGNRIRLYVSTWVNPHPHKQVAGIDYLKPNDTAAAPFCIAITLVRTAEREHQEPDRASNGDRSQFFHR